MKFNTMVCYRKHCDCGVLITNEKYDRCFNCNMKHTRRCATKKCYGRVKGEYVICYNCNNKLKIEAQKNSDY